MKKLFFIIVTICSALTLQAQQEDSVVNKREHGDHYFLSEPFENDCTPLDIFKYSDEASTVCFNYFKQDIIGTGGGFWVADIIYNKISDIAQPFYIDTTLNINIIGISILSPYRYYLGRNGYVCIADSNLNIQRRTPIYDIPIPVESQRNMYQDGGPTSAYFWWLDYEEFFFDTSINMSGKFYAILDNPKPKPYTGYNWSNVSDRTNFHILECYLAYATESTLTPNLCPVTMEPLMRYVQIHNPNMTIDDYYSMTSDEQILYSIYKDTNAEVDFLSSDTVWYPVSTEPANESIFLWKHNQATAYYIFPIFDTITQNVDSSALEKIDLENYTLVYPNPTNREVNVQCSFLIKNIEIYNSLGSMVKEITDIKANHYLLELNAYEKGNYILRLNTNGGTIEKKVLLQ
jgi:hypothetical protein